MADDTDTAAAQGRQRWTQRNATSTATALQRGALLYRARRGDAEAKEALSDYAAAEAERTAQEDGQ